MEIVLNLVWVSLAAVMFGLWLRFAPRHGRADCRKLQFVALAALVLLLFPVISVTDDLQAAQNPAETDSCQRRDHVCATPHTLFPAIIAPPSPVFSGLSLASVSMPAPGNFVPLAAANPALAPIQSRPPPTA